VLSAKLLINDQIQFDRKKSIEDLQETFKEEIEELKENLERKEYLL